MARTPWLGPGGHPGADRADDRAHAVIVLACIRGDVRVQGAGPFPAHDPSAYVFGESKLLYANCMRLPGKVRETVDRVIASADETRQAITVIGGVAVVALVIALIALVRSHKRVSIGAAA